MKNTILEKGRQIEVLLKCDVVVVGGGPAGIAAAAGAAKVGVQVVLVERYSCLGGNVTIAAVEPPSWYKQEKTTMPGGVQKEIEDRMIALDAVRPCSFRPSIGLSYDTEMYKYMADCYIKDLGITPVYHCIGTVPYMEGNVVKGVITESKSGRKVILAKRVIDTTGDADLVYRSGAPVLKGDPQTGKLGAGTLKFFASDVDILKLEAAMSADPESRDPYVHKLLYKPFIKAEEAGEPPLQNSLNKIYYTAVSNDSININLATYDRELDGTDVLSLTASEIKLRKEVLEVLRRLRKYGTDAGFADAKLRYFAMAVGVRETRRIVGNYTLTFDDIFKRGRFDDTIGVFPVYADGIDIKEIPYTDAYFQVPFRILTPQKVENILAAGRCISGERSAVPTTRQMDFCMVTGQAAGTASALSIKQDVVTRNVDIKLVQLELRRQGLRVD
ncbi:FAD-dependent oxidoreductase [Leadbettera azotonutricia]|uniref:Invasion protein IbeA n=1 Tax=Leadbettera azotonutricia (strain ATCC BAA-888 / DSM 13862 / ZAS-9) TaxID=545695 RepID=F5YG93_LEAAZ|nr:FAD-dependent oxidoreductase [Leadbettera azotonutricia]AEF82115.1 invasion protein IbeA [Leadbettera azotonutricia ZAS-9]